MSIFDAVIAFLTVGGAGSLVYFLYHAGKNSVRKDIAENLAEVKHEQLEAVVNKPDSSDRLSSGTF